ncbi:MAG: response regulator [Alphaproteobacteria bacterium]|nr:response regulator [Alphaproteobacteria bacterium]
MKRLVIADDDDVALAFLKAKMGQRGFVVTAVKDGAAALLAVASIKPDMVILDVMMPGLDGFEVLRQLKANPATQGVPVVLLSARHNVADIARAKALGAADYIIKPFVSDAVVEQLQELAPGGTTAVQRKA